MITEQDLVCFNCHRTPEQIPVYVAYGAELGMSAAEYVMEEEGTLNQANGHFACDDCYVKLGMPSAPVETGGWKAP